MQLCVFLNSLHWPTAVDDMGRSGTTNVELLLLYVFGAGRSKSQVEGGRRISVSAVPAGPSIDIWRSGRFWVLC